MMMYCPHCKTAIEADGTYTFCPSCGGDLPTISAAGSWVAPASQADTGHAAPLAGSYVGTRASYDLTEEDTNPDKALPMVEEAPEEAPEDDTHTPEQSDVVPEDAPIPSDKDLEAYRAFGLVTSAAEDGAPQPVAADVAPIAETGTGYTPATEASARQPRPPVEDAEEQGLSPREARSRAKAAAKAEREQARRERAAAKAAERAAKREAKERAKAAKAAYREGRLPEREGAQPASPDRQAAAQASPTEAPAPIRRRRRKSRRRRQDRSQEIPERSVSYERPKQSAQDALGFLKVYDGRAAVIQNAPESWSMTITFDDVSFQSAREEQQTDIYRQWANILGTFDENTSAKVQIVCRALDPEEFRRDMMMPLSPAGPENDNRWRERINRIIERQISSTRQNVVRDRYLTLTVKAPTRMKATPQLVRLAEACVRQLKTIGVSARVLDADEWLNLVDSITNPYSRRPGGIHITDLAQGMGLTAIDLVSPADFTRSSDRCHISWGRAFGQALYVKDWANTVRTDMLSDLAELPINQIITVNLDPWSHADAIDVVEGKLTDVKVQKADYYLRHQNNFGLSDEMLPTDLQDANETLMGYREDLVNRDQRLFDVTVCMLTWGHSEAEVDQNAEQMQDVLSNFTVRIAPLDSCQGQGFAASLPTGTCEVPYSAARTTAPAAALIPFTSAELMDLSPTSIWVGSNLTSKNFVCVDRVAMNASNGFIFGQTGRGKSVFAKWSILQSYLSDPTARFVVLDPEHEYIELARALNAPVVKIGGEGTSHVNPFDLVLGEDASVDWAGKTDAIISEVEMMTHGLSPLQMSVVDHCISQVYERYLDTLDPEDIPTYEDLWQALMEYPAEEGRVLAATIERYVHGQANLFNHKTDVDTGARLVVYDISETPENLKSLALFILLGETWNITTRNRKDGRRTWVFVDEMQLLLENEHAITYLDNYYSRARKYGAIPTCITQNIERVLAHEKTRLMLANSDFLVILGQSATDAEALGGIVHLSDAHIDVIRTASPGEGLLMVEKSTIIPFDSHLPEDSDVYRLVTTKPGEMAGLDIIPDTVL